MNSRSLLSLYLFALCLLAFPAAEAGKQIDKATSSDGDDSKDNTIEVNPEYVEPELEEDDDGGSDSEWTDDDENDEESDSMSIKTVKASIERALKSKKKQFIKNRVKITFALAVFAFRREIYLTVLHFAKTGLVDPKTGKVRLNPTQALKLILFVDFMRRMQNSSGSDTANPNSLHALSVLGQANPVLGALISKFLKASIFNPAYIPPINQHYTFERINERYLKDGLALHKAIHASHDEFTWPTSDSTHNDPIVQKNVSISEQSNQTVIILDLSMLGQSPSEQIRQPVSFLLSQYRNMAMANEGSNTTELEVVVILESPGGSAVDFGLAAQQLLRLRNEPGVLLTICVDRVAASGGYMLACTASPGQLFAAPFSVVGSIGVIGQIININELLEKTGITPIVLRGGKDKAPLGLIGEITKDGKAKTQSMIDDTHKAFKNHVATARPILKDSIDTLGTGDVWLGSDAVDLDLVDRITTSDEYIGQKVVDGARVLKMVKCPRRGLLFGRQQSPSEVGVGQLSFGNVLSSVLTQVKGSFGLSHNSILSHQDQLDVPSVATNLPLVVSRVKNPKAQF
jgi:signal peptide peptidase SppA